MCENSLHVVRAEQEQTVSNMSCLLFCPLSDCSATTQNNALFMCMRFYPHLSMKNDDFVQMIDGKSMSFNTSSSHMQLIEMQLKIQNTKMQQYPYTAKLHIYLFPKNGGEKCISGFFFFLCFRLLV